MKRTIEQKTSKTQAEICLKSIKKINKYANNNKHIQIIVSLCGQTLDQDHHSMSSNGIFF